MDEKLVHNIVMDEKMVQKIVMDEELIQKIVMDEELIQTIVMDEELFQNGVMDEKFVKNFVMGAKIDPKVVMDLSVFKIGGWYNPVIENCRKNVLIRMSRDCRSEFRTEIHSFFMIQYLEQPFVCGSPNVKESKWHSQLLTLLCEGLCELQVTLQQQHFAACKDLHEHFRRH